MKVPARQCRPSIPASRRQIVHGAPPCLRYVKPLMRGSLIVATTSAIAPPALAHHGIDFLVVQTAHLPERGTGYAMLRQDYLSEEQDVLELEPAVLFGATDWASVELHAHVEKPEGESADYESLSPAVQLRFTPRDQPLAVGLSAEYEVAQESDHEDALEMALLVSHESSKLIAAANILYERHQGEPSEWGYAGGVRYAFGSKHGAGVELTGSFESGDSSEVMVGYYGTFSPTFTFNAGLGGRVDGDEQVVRTAFIWRFR